MLRKDFNKWPIIPIADNVLDELGMHITSLGYLENGLFWFVGLLDDITDEENKQLMGLFK